MCTWPRWADGDAIALTQAAQLVLLTNARTPEGERTVEHLAFVLLTAAFGQVTRQRQDARAATEHPPRRGG
jgi:hypothetical protein